MVMDTIKEPMAGIMVAVSVMCFAPLAEARDYLSTIGDVPLAEGLQELPDAGFVFDKPQGRIVQLTASHHSEVTQQALIAFYRESLPNLGWQARETAPGLLTFFRRGEILRLTFTADLVIFDLTPMVIQ